MTSSTPSEDRIFVRGLTAECIIGCFDWERRVKQTVMVDLELRADCRRASVRDDVADTVDYGHVATRARAYIEASEFKLIETLAHRLALLLLTEFGLEWVRICVNKPGAVRDASEVGVAIERSRADLAG